ncbi:MAG: nucleotide exchange factor GrpE [Sulfurovum sp.]|nr:nucleotide exchange factor GrpE [Sulfurovaceae bacterium]
MSEKTKDEPIVEEAPQEEKVLNILEEDTFSLPENDNELEKVKAEASDWKDKFLRAHADFENTKKRLTRDKSTAISYANENFSKDILAVMDSFDQALLAIYKAEEDTQEESEVINKMKEGVTLTYEQLKKILEKNYITEIDSEGEFDPNLHQAIMQVDSTQHEEGHIVQVMQKGYMIKDRVLRPSMVSTKK